MSLPEQNITKKGREFLVLEFELTNNKKYKVKAIRDSVVYAKEANGHLLELYYLVAWKGYPKEENTWELSLAIMHLWKMINTFHMDHPEKPIAISVFLDSVLPMAKPTIQLSIKQKRGRQAKAIRYNKWDNKEDIRVSSEATRKISKSVRFSMELEAGKWPEICLFDAKSVGEPALAVWIFTIWLRWELNSTLF